MKYHNDGVLRTEQDSTLVMKSYSQKRQVTWMEYLPLFSLCILMAGLLINALLG